MNDYDDAEVIRQEFSNLVERATQRKIAFNNAPQSPFDQNRRDAANSYYEALEKATNYSVTLLANGAHRAEGSAYRLTPELQSKIAPIDAFIDEQWKLRTGYDALPHERAAVLNLLDEFSTDKDERRVMSDDGRQERQELIDVLPKIVNLRSSEELEMELDAGLITSIEYKEEASRIERMSQVTAADSEKPIGREVLVHIDDTQFEELTNSLSEFRKALRDRIESRDDIFASNMRAIHLDSTSGQSPNISDGRSDSDGAKKPDPKRRRIDAPTVSDSYNDPTMTAPGHLREYAADGEVTSAQRSPSPHQYDNRDNARSRDASSLVR